MAETDHHSAATYRGFCVFCGITLLVGFFMPIVTKGFVSDVEVQFVSIEGLEDSSTPGLVKFLLIYPVIAAVAAFVMAAIPNAIARSITFLVVGLIPTVLLFVNEDTKSLVGQMSGPMMGLDDFDWRVILGMVAWLGILSAAFGGKQRPSGLFAPLAGAVGASAYILTQVVPIEIGFESIMPAAIPFKMIGETGASGEQITIAVLLLAKLALGATAAILAFCQFAPGPGRLGRYRMMGGFWITGALVIFLLPIVIIVMNMGEGGGWQLLQASTTMLKIVAIFLPFYLMIPYGIAGIGNMGIADAPPASARASGGHYEGPEHVHYHTEHYPPASQAPPAPAPEPPAPAGPRTVEDRLAELQRLFEGGLITEDELESKRNKILEDL